MAQAPRTRYASCGETDIAYQVFGDGPVDLVLLPGPSIPIDSVDAEPSMYRFHRRLASFARVIRLDQRGIGLSSRVAHDTIGPKFWAKDVIGVMNAAGCERATIVALFTAWRQHHQDRAIELSELHPEIKALAVGEGGLRQELAAAVGRLVNSRMAGMVLARGNAGGARRAGARPRSRLRTPRWRRSPLSRPS